MFIDPHLDPARQHYSDFIQILRALRRPAVQPLIEVHRVCYEGSGPASEFCSPELTLVYSAARFRFIIGSPFGRLVSRLSDESESGTDFVDFTASGRALEVSTQISSGVLDATIYRAGQATVPRPVFCKLVRTLRYFRGTGIDFEFFSGIMVLNGRTQIRHALISLEGGSARLNVGTGPEQG
jgi:hypothetical protein